MEMLRARLPWYFVRGTKYDPPFAQFLDDQEIQICADWYTDTTDDPFIGDSGFIAISMISELILANQITQAIQIGHYAGFGSLVMGMMLRKVSPHGRLISFDIDAKMTDFCDSLMVRTGLDSVVKHVCVDSTDPITAELAGSWLGSTPGLIFIDASKQYKNTIAEVSMWTRFINGYIVAHDVSQVAKGEQANGILGVSDGLVDSRRFAPNELILIDPKSEFGDGFPYLDPCGLGIAISRGTDRLPMSNKTISEILRGQHILPHKKLLDPENWFLGDDFFFEPGKLIKKAGSESWATCFGPVRQGQKLAVEIVVSGKEDCDIKVCAGGIPGTTANFRGPGRHFGEFVVGSDNSKVGIFGSAESAFEIEALTVVFADEASTMAALKD